MRLWAMLTRRKLVALHDADGEKTVALERKFSDGARYAYRHTMPKQIVFLNGDGTTSGLAHVRKWQRI